MARKINHLFPQPAVPPADFLPGEAEDLPPLPALPRPMSWPPAETEEPRLEKKTAAANKHGTETGPQGIVRRKKNSA